MNAADWLNYRQTDDMSLENWLLAKKISERKLPYVFISYAHKDAHILNQIVEKLTENNLPLWFDNRELLKNADKNFNEQIEEGLEFSFCFIAFVSENYWESRYCPHELEMALKNRFRVPLEEEYKFRRYHEHILIVDLDGWQDSPPDKIRLFRQINEPSIINYSGNFGDENANVKNIVDSLLKNSLIQWMISGDTCAVPEIPDFFKHLKNYHENLIGESAEIDPTLFPRVKNLNLDEFDEEKFTEATEILPALQKGLAANILVYGEGGSGKTVALHIVGSSFKIA